MWRIFHKGRGPYSDVTNTYKKLLLAMKIFESHSLLKESGHITSMFFGISSETTNVKKNVSF
jgi:hypothetical protein